MKQCAFRFLSCIAFALLAVMMPMCAHATSGFELKLMAYNIKYSFEFRGVNGEIYDIAEAIASEEPHVIALQEIGNLIREGEFERQAENLAIHLTELTGQDYHAVFLGNGDHDNNWDPSFFAETHGVSGSGGTAIVSRLTLAREPEFLTAHRDPLSARIEYAERLAANPAYQVYGNRPFAVTRATYEVSTENGVEEVDFYSVHLISGGNVDRRAEEMHAIERLVRPGRPAFLMGDLNAEDPELSGFSEWRNVGDGSIESYSSVNHRKQIDWILYRNLSDADNVSFYEVKNAAGTSHRWSDHTPIVLDAEYAMCVAHDPSAYDPSFCAGREAGNSACGLCGVGEGGCSGDAECKVGLVCSANICSVPGTPAPISIPRLLRNLAIGGGGPFQTRHDFNVVAARDMMVSINVRNQTTAAVSSATPASAWITIDGEKASRRIRLRSNVGMNVVTFKHVPIAAGEHVVSVHFTSDQVDLDRVRFFTANSNPYELFPYIVGNGDLQAEAFDVGGYVDLTPRNDGQAVRFEAPDIYADAGTDYVLMAEGEELSHSLSVTAATTMKLRVRYRSTHAQDVEVYGDGVLLVQETLPAAPDWQIKDVGDVTFAAGDTVLSLRTPAMPGSATAFEFDHYRFAREWTSGPISGVAWPADGSRVQAEYYDIKGFVDADDNSLDAYHYRADADQFGHAPDIWHFRADFVSDDDAENRYFVWKTDVNDALVYTIDDAGQISDQITLHYATTKTVDVEVRLNNALIGTSVLTPSGGWGKNLNHWDDHVISGLDLRGGGELKLIFLDAGLNLDWIEVGTP